MQTHPLPRAKAKKKKEVFISHFRKLYAIKSILNSVSLMSVWPVQSHRAGHSEGPILGVSGSEVTILKLSNFPLAFVFWKWSRKGQWILLQRPRALPHAQPQLLPPPASQGRTLQQATCSRPPSLSPPEHRHGGQGRGGPWGRVLELKSLPYICRLYNHIQSANVIMGILFNLSKPPCPHL